MSENTNLPVNWEEQMQALIREEGIQVKPQSSSITFKGGFLRYQGDVVPGNKLDVIVLAAARENSYYDTEYDPESTSSPACFALATVDDGEMVPHPNSPRPQHKNCRDCEWMEYGTAKGGTRKGKACQERWRLAILPASVLKEANAEAAIGNAEMATTKLPVMSGKNWTNFSNTARAVYKRPSFMVVAEMGTAPDPKAQFKVVFAPKEKLADEVFPFIVARREVAMEVLLQPYDVVGEEEAAAPKEPEAKAKAAAKGKKWS